MPFHYPVVLDLTGLPVLVVGGGRIALGKAQALAAAGAALTVVAPEVADGFAELPATVHRRRFEPGDVAGHQLVVTATDDRAVNSAVAGTAKAAGVFVNAADDPSNCTFALPAIARNGRLTATVSTGGGSPALARHLRDRIAAEILTDRAAAAADTLAAERDEIHAAGRSTLGLDWDRKVRELLE